MEVPTFEDAARLWPRLRQATEIEINRDDDLFAACEEVILKREITSAEDVVLVCQVLLDNLVLGQRSDQLDIHAMTSVRDWAARLTAGRSLGAAVRRRRMRS